MKNGYYENIVNVKTAHEISLELVKNNACSFFVMRWNLNSDAYLHPHLAEWWKHGRRWVSKRQARKVDITRVVEAREVQNPVGGKKL